MLKLGVLGMSEGNKHPYSWSAIVNGDYDEGAMIAFWKELTGHDGISFLWILPLAFIAGAVVSYVLSFLPTEKKQFSEMKAQ